MIRLLAVTLMLTALPASGQEAVPHFIAIPNPNPTGGGVWVLDTLTGEVKFCYLGSSEVTLCSRPSK
jgi:hypothetical protein